MFWGNDIDNDQVKPIDIIGFEDFRRIVMANVYVGGGTDQGWSAANFANEVTLLDSIVARAQGIDTHLRAFASLMGHASSNGNSNDMSLIGNLFLFNDERNPLVANNFTMCNHVNYGRRRVGVEIRDQNTPQANKANIVGLWEKRGDSHNTGRGPISFHPNDDQYLAGAEWYFSDTRAVEYSTDEWDVVSDPDNHEADHRSNVPLNTWPDGLVCAPNRSQTEADYFTLMTQNAGPFQHERLAFIQTDIDHLENGTGAIVDTYNPTPPPNVAGAYSVPANPHTAGEDNPLRTVIEEDLRDKAEAMYAN
jgi:hypothetical protein